MLYLKSNLKHMRKSKNLTYIQLSELSNVPHSVIFRIENGKTLDPSISTVIRLCDALSIDINSFLFKDIQ